MVELIRQGQEDGSIPNAIDSKVTARLMLCLLQGMRVTPQTGFAGGSARTINSLAGASRTTLMSISTKSWDSSDCLCFHKTFRGRKQDVLSESRMR